MGQDDLQKPADLPDEIFECIHLLRGQRVMLDEDLARLYGVETKRLNEQVRRNPGRFPEDFMFQLTDEEWESLRSQFATSNEGRGGRRYPPFAFTEQGVAMLSSVLNSERAITVNVEIMRAFVRFRQFLANHQELAAKLAELEKKIEARLGRHDQQLKMLFEALRQLREEVRKPPPAPTPRRRIGFQADNSEDENTSKASSKPRIRKKKK